MIDFRASKLQPEPAEVLAAQGMDPATGPSAKVAALLQQALEMYRALSEPCHVLAPVSRQEFAAVYAGQGLNAAATPLDAIIPRAEQLSLFAFTLGMPISREIARLFQNHDFALASMLDAVASLAADNAGRQAESMVLRQLENGRPGTAHMQVILYSPGYCGWHISGQKKLFEFLRPEKIGIQLNERFLMNPLKSLTGVLLAGEASIHQFSAVYPFCSQCKSPTCRERGVFRSA